MLAAMQYSKPSLTASGVSPFHQPGDGRFARTVSWPGIIGLKEYWPFCPVTSQLPIMSTAPARGACSAIIVPTHDRRIRRTRFFIAPPSLLRSADIRDLPDRAVFVPIGRVAYLHEI